MSFSILLAVGVVVAIVLVVTLSSGSSSNPVSTDFTDEDILREARSGRKIQAIKLYRTLYGVGLKEAKEAVERML